MRFLEQVAFPLSGGALSVFAVAVVLKESPWQIAFVAVAVAVVGWGLQLPVVVSGVLGAVAWAMVTGFDIAKTGSLVVAGVDDGFRAGLLIGLGLVAGAMRAEVPASGFLGSLMGPRTSPPRYVAARPSPATPFPVLPACGPGPVARHRGDLAPGPSENRETMMSDMVFVLLTVAVFVLLGLLVKGVERL